MKPPLLPGLLQTERLCLRRWHHGDAPALLPVLEANAAYLLAWIPEHVGSPAPLPQLEARLTGFSAAFEDGREWRYGVFSPDQATLIGEVSLFPRDSTGRVRVEEADRLEIGYWIRADRAGRGYATEAARAIVELSSTIPGMVRVEIRCDPRNLPSAVVPRRLGFRLEAGEPEAALLVWVLDLR